MSIDLPPVSGAGNSNPVRVTDAVKDEFDGHMTAARNNRDLQVADATNWTNSTNGRSLLKGPTNGNWGGGCWSGGEYNCWGHGPAGPKDSGDRVYMAHDLCYENNTVEIGGKKTVDATGKDICDAALVRDLKGLPKNAKDWAEPPPKGTEADSERYRDRAIWYFGK